LENGRRGDLDADRIKYKMTALERQSVGRHAHND
jgi:hypothetical protein